MEARQRKRARILGKALALKDGYVKGLAKIAAFCQLDEGELRKAYRDTELVRELIEKRGGRFGIDKTRLIDLDLVLYDRRHRGHQRGALHPSRKRGAHARFLRGSTT